MSCHTHLENWEANQWASKYQILHILLRLNLTFEPWTRPYTSASNQDQTSSTSIDTPRPSTRYNTALVSSTTHTLASCSRKKKHQSHYSEIENTRPKTNLAFNWIQHGLSVTERRRCSDMIGCDCTINNRLENWFFLVKEKKDEPW